MAFSATREERVTYTAMRTASASGMEWIIREMAERFREDLERNGCDVGEVDLQVTDDFATASKIVRITAELY